MLTACLSALLGLYAETHFLHSSLWALYALFVFSVTLTVYVAATKKGFENRVARLLAVFSFFFFLFIVRGQMESHLFSQTDTLFVPAKRSLYVIDRKKEDTGMRYTVSWIENKETYHAYMISDFYPKYELGDTLEGEVSLSKNEGNFYNADKTKSFDYQTYLKEKGIVGTFLYPKLVVTEHVEMSLMISLVKQREKFEEILAKYIPFENGDLARATLFGSHSLTKSEQQLFVNAGISHIVALSGFNITILISFLAVILFFLPFWVRLGISTLLVCFYLAMTEMSGSLVRASCMALITLLLLVRGYVPDQKKLLLLGSLLLAFIFPQSVLSDASLQLSFLAMTGVLFVYPILFERVIQKYIGLRKLFLEVMCMAASVTLLIFPYAAYTFGTVSPYGIIATVLVTAFIPLVTILGILVLLFSYLLPIVSTLLAFPLSLGITFIFGVARMVTSLPYSSVAVQISFSALLAYYGLFAVIISFLQKKYNNTSTDSDKNGKMEKIVIDNERVIQGVMRF